VILLFILVWGMFAGWIAHLLLARNQPISWAEQLVVGLAGRLSEACSSAGSMRIGSG
jgi:uncharacterized membrane protein YeaQ/YmgE (transglycosylase-associated protein family)